jgi:hypothetical protein
MGASAIVTTGPFHEVAWVDNRGSCPVNDTVGGGAAGPGLLVVGREGAQTVFAAQGNPAVRVGRLR